MKRRCFRNRGPLARFVRVNIKGQVIDVLSQVCRGTLPAHPAETWSANTQDKMKEGKTYNSDSNTKRGRSE